MPKHWPLLSCNPLFPAVQELPVDATTHKGSCFASSTCSCGILETHHLTAGLIVQSVWDIARASCLCNHRFELLCNIVFIKMFPDFNENLNSLLDKGLKFLTIKSSVISDTEISDLSLIYHDWDFPQTPKIFSGYFSGSALKIHEFIKINFISLCLHLFFLLGGIFS